MKINYLKKFLFVNIALSLLPTTCALADTVLGVNNVHIGWLAPELREKTVGEMRDAGVASVRVDLIPPYDQTIDSLEILSRHGISIELVVGLGGGELLNSRITKRSGRGQIWSVAGLSQLNVPFFERRFGAIWQEIERRHIHLLAVELGNEINWAAFNGDLALTNPGLKPRAGAPGIGALIDPTIYHIGMRNYVQALKSLRTLRDLGHVNRSTLILSAGLASGSAETAATQGAEYVDPVETLLLLKALGLDDIVDGYGLHMYPDLNVTPGRRRITFEKLTSLCGGVGGHPCWLTEWGIFQQSTECVVNESKTKSVASEVVELIESARNKIAGSYYFEWSDPTDPYSIWRCGGLTQVGKTILQN